MHNVTNVIIFIMMLAKFLPVALIAVFINVVFLRFADLMRGKHNSCVSKQTPCCPLNNNENDFSGEY